MLGGGCSHVDEHIERLNQHYPLTRGVILRLENSESLGVLREDWLSSGGDRHRSVMGSIDQTVHLETNDKTPSSKYLKERLASLRTTVVSIQTLADVSTGQCCHRTAREAYGIGAALVAGLDFVDVKSARLADLVSNQILLARLTRIMT